MCKKREIVGKKMCSIVNENNVTVQNNNVVLTTFETKSVICHSFPGIVFVHLLVRFQRFLALFFWLCGAQQILTRLRGLRDCTDHLASVSVCGLCWPFCGFSSGFSSASMKTPVLLCVLLFSQSWAFEFIIDGEWESETVRLK